VRGPYTANHHDDGPLRRENVVAEAKRHRPSPSHSSAWIHDDLSQGGTILQLITIIIICNEIMCLPRNCVILVEIGGAPVRRLQRAVSPIEVTSGTEQAARHWLAWRLADGWRSDAARARIHR
jgi:hypothetical protein